MNGIDRPGGDDPEAIYQLAVRHVTGDGVARNWRTARELFGTAHAAGHDGATRAYASLLALGAAAPPDWSAAITVLEQAAPRSDVAAHSLGLIRSMDLDSNGAPMHSPPVTPVAMSPRVAIAERIFTADECAHMRRLATPLLQPSFVVDPTSGKQLPHPIRTSESAILGPIQQDLVVHALNRRIAAVTGTCIEQGEPITLLRYEPGQQYRLHHDCLPGEQNQRFMTAIVYLNDDFDGGATSFEALGQTFKPATGGAIIFLNTVANERPDERSRHAGLAVTTGEKWVATRWIRRSRFDPWGLYG